MTYIIPHLRITPWISECIPRPHDAIMENEDSYGILAAKKDME